jgi:transposase InsO family protein
LVRAYLGKVTGLSRAQITRLIAQQRATGRLRDHRGAPARPFVRRYTREDIRLLAELDALHGHLSGPATRKLCERAWAVFGDARYVRLAGISNGHLYNLRGSPTYQRCRGRVEKTRPVQIRIGERRRPHPAGRPGFLRVDSVHQGDLDGIKGLYHINLVDAVTQFQFVGSVERIAERFLLPVLEALLEAFPFSILGFHSDNGSEYVNRQVAGLLEKLHVEFTKSRARRSNDNALVESKNGSVVRKHLGYSHIPSRFAQSVNAFAREVLSPYLNFHRPCFFPTEVVDTKGRVRKRYPYAAMMTPYEKLKSLPEAAHYLKPGVTFAQLDAQALAISDQEAVRRLNTARAALFAIIDHAQQPAA